MSSALINVDYASLTDAELLTLYQRQRDPEAFAALVDRHGSMVMGIADRILGCRHSAEDVVQATFLILAKDSKRIRQAASVSSWLYGVAYRIAARISSRRIRERRSRASMQAGQATVVDDPLANVSAQYERNAVLDEVQRLPERLRTPMILRYFQGQTNAEVAAALGLSEAAVEGRVKRGRNQLRMRLIRKGVTFAAAIHVMDSIATHATAALPSPIQALILQTRHDASPSNASQPSQIVRVLAHQEIQRMALISLVRTATAALLATGVVTSAWIFAGNHALFAQDHGAASSITVTAAQETNVSSDVSATITTTGPDRNIPTADPFATSPQQDDPFAAQSQPQDPFAPLSSNSEQSGDDELPTRRPQSQSATTSSNPFAAPSVSTRSERAPSEPMHLREFTAAEQRVYEAMDNQVKLDFLDSPLNEVVEFISQSEGIQVIIDTRALENEGLTADAPVSLSIHGVKLSSAMDLMLAPLDLTTIVLNEVLVVTTRSRAEEHIEVRVYEHDAALAKLIETTVAPETWSSTGGNGSIQAVQGGLIVSQTQAVHREIEELLRQLSRLKK